MHIFDTSVTYGLQYVRTYGLQYVRNIHAKYIKNTLKALGVDYRKYAVSAIIQYMQWPKIAKVKNAINFSNYFFTIKHLHAHLQYVSNIPALMVKVCVLQI